MKTREPTPWPVPELLQHNRNAAVLYLALRWPAGDSRQLNTTRARIADVCGLHRETITEAMSTLHEAGWVVRNRGHAKGRRWYRITFPSKTPFPWAVETGSRERRKHKSAKAGATGSSAASKTRSNRLKRQARLGGSNRPNSLERVGGGLTPTPPMPTGGASAATPGETTTKTTTADDGELRPTFDYIRGVR